MSFDSLQSRIHLARLVFRDHFSDFFLCRLSCVVHCLFRLLLHENNVRALRTRCWNTILDDKIMRIWTLHKISLTSYCHLRFDLLVIMTILAESISSLMFRSVMSFATMLFHVLDFATHVITLIEHNLTTQLIIVHEQLEHDLCHEIEHDQAVEICNDVESWLNCDNQLNCRALLSSMLHSLKMLLNVTESYRKSTFFAHD